MKALAAHEQAEKVVLVLELIETTDVVPRKFLKKLRSTDGIWEVCVQSGNNIFRLPGFSDGENLVILNHAVTQKTQKTPKREIKKAENIPHEKYRYRRFKILIHQ
jgi:phage-related protein